MGGDHTCYTCGRLAGTPHAEGCPRRKWGETVTEGQCSWQWEPPREPHPLRMMGVGPQQVLDAALLRRVRCYELDITAGAEDEPDELTLWLDGEDGTVQEVRISARFSSLIVTSRGIERSAFLHAETMTRLMESNPAPADGDRLPLFAVSRRRPWWKWRLPWS